MDLPAVGLGTMGVADSRVVTTALEVGYRHLDTAQIYENERLVGEGLRAAAVDRADVTLATKLWVDSLAAGSVRPGTEQSLDRLGVDAVDLLYVHRPRGEYDPATTLPAIDAVREAGLTRHVGLSNFEPEQLATARDHLERPLAAHQVEFHPFHWREDLLADAQAHGYQLVAYSPLAGGLVFNEPTIEAIADAHDTSAAAVSLAWVTSHDNVVAVAKGSSRAHLAANLAAAELELTAEERRRIERIDDEIELYPE